MKNIIFLFVILLVFKVSIAQRDTLNTSSLIVYKEYKYKNGRISSNGFLKNNLPYGFWKSYYITGVIKSEGNWINNKLDSIWIFYDQLGDTLQKINYFKGKKNGYQFNYFNDHKYKNTVSSKELYINILFFLYGKSEF